jgi:hypothetical protein
MVAAKSNSSIEVSVLIGQAGSRIKFSRQKRWQSCRLPLFVTAKIIHRPATASAVDTRAETPGSKKMGFLKVSAESIALFGTESTGRQLVRVLTKTAWD